VSDIIIFVPNPEPAGIQRSQNPTTMPTVTVIVPPPANLGPAPTDAQLQKLVLKPGVGVGDVKFGATRKEVIAFMGQPQEVLRVGPAEEMVYVWDGLNMALDSNGLLQTIVAGGTTVTSHPGATVQVRPFAVSTDKRIHVGSTRDEVVGAYGKDYGEVGVMVMDHPEVHETQLVYLKLGLVLILDKQTNRCVEMMLLSPAYSKVNPVPSPQ